jgi:ABC-type phosphate/phosphonate transport system substrate-binding protein
MTRQRVHAAILPTSFVSQRLDRSRIRAVMTTEPIPHLALSAAPGVQAALRERLRLALLNADKSAEGRHMLESVGFARFEPAPAELYAGQHRILQKYWGY